MAADDTIAELLRTAHESVTAAAVPEPLQAFAFEKALDLLAARHGLEGAPAAPAPAAGPTTQQQAPLAGGSEKSLEKIAEKLKLPRETITEVFHIDGENVALSVASSKLASSKLAGAKQIALLIAAARHAGGWDSEWTASAEIRRVASDYGKFDENNFAKALTEQGAYFGFQGRGEGRKLKVNRKGFEDAATLVRTLAGEDTS